MKSKVTAVLCDDRKVTGVTCHHDGQDETLEADFYVMALPVEQMVRLANDRLQKLEPRFGQLQKLVTRWMNGILFYLHKDVPVVHGHVIYIDAPWSLTSISQRQFWTAAKFADMGEGNVAGILSVDVSDWDTPG